MLKRFRAPSPALVISLIALFVALGGTSIAATKAITAKHKDAKTDTKLVKKLAPSLSVKHAKTADSAATAANATHATSADSATNATNATNATHATSATTATNATNASNSSQLGGLGPNSYQKVPTTTQHFTIAGSTLLPDGDGTGHAIAYNLTADQFCTATGGGDFYAPVHLPNGAVITGMSMDYVDDSGSALSNGQVYITQFPLLNQGGSYDDLGSTSLANTGTPGAAATAVTGAISTAVDNSKYAYNIIGFGSAAGARYCAVNVSYTIPAGFSGATGHRSQPLGTGTRGAR